MVQATVCTKDDDELAGALYAVVLRLSHLPANEQVDKAGLAVLHEARRLGIFRPSDLAAQMRLDLSTISRHCGHWSSREWSNERLTQMMHEPSKITITAHGADVLDRALGIVPPRSVTRSRTGQRATEMPCVSFSACWPTICPTLPRPMHLGSWRTGRDRGPTELCAYQPKR